MPGRVRHGDEEHLGSGRFPIARSRLSRPPKIRRSPTKSAGKVDVVVEEAHRKRPPNQGSVAQMRRSRACPPGTKHADVGRRLRLARRAWPENAAIRGRRIANRRAAVQARVASISATKNPEGPRRPADARDRGDGVGKGDRNDGPRHDGRYDPLELRDAPRGADPESVEADLMFIATRAVITSSRTRREVRYTSKRDLGVEPECECR